MQDNNIEFWRKFVAEYFAPNARKKWCVSLYGTSHQTNGVFPQVCFKTKKTFWFTIDRDKESFYSYMRFGCLLAC